MMANRPACARPLAVAPAGRSAASYTITRDRKRDLTQLRSQRCFKTNMAGSSGDTLSKKHFRLIRAFWSTCMSFELEVLWQGCKNHEIATALLARPAVR